MENEVIFEIELDSLIENLFLFRIKPLFSWGNYLLC